MTTTAEPPLDVPLPEQWPQPRPKCRVCAALHSQRTKAQAAGDFSKVSDCNVEIRAHESPQHRRRR